MLPSGSPTPSGGAQSVPNSLLRSNSGLMAGAQSNSQQPFSSLVSPRTQFNNPNNGNNGGMGLMGNMQNVSSFVNHSIGNGMNLQHLQQFGSSEADPLAFATSGGGSQSMNQLGADHSQPQQLETVQNFHQQYSVPQQQQQLRGRFSNVGGLGPVKLEQQMVPGDQNGPTQQQLQSLRGLGQVKMEPQQLQSMRGLGPVKLEQQHSDSSMFLQQQQQQQQLLQMSRQSPQAAAQMSLLQQQQRILQLQQQQQQQQQLLKGLPPRNQQQLQQSMALRNQMKPNNYEPGTCSRRLTQYMYHQQHRPQDNSIEFWRKFVSEYFAPNAKKRWCVSLYGSGRQTTGVFPQDVWHCEICNRKPGRGFETTAEVLPRLCQIKYASGTLEELLYIDMPRESQNSVGQIVLDYPKAIQESVFEQLRVVRDGHLRIVFNPDLKISSWEFCARRHEELIPRRVIIPQVSQLGAVVQKYQNAAQSTSSALSSQDLQNSCNSFVASARQLAKALEVPLVNDLGYTKRYVRCLQISEVVNSMKDLIDYSKETKTGPMDSLINFPRRTSSSAGQHSQQHAQQLEEQHQTMVHNSNRSDQSAAHATIMQLASYTNGVGSINNSINGPPSTSQSTTAIAALLHHQNSFNSRQESPLRSANGLYGGANTTQLQSTSSSSSLPPSQPNPSSPFSPPTPTTSNNNTIPASRSATTHLNAVNSPANMSTMQQQQAAQTQEDANDTQSSMQQIIQEMMMSSPVNSVNSLGNEVKGMNGMTPTLNGGGMTSNSGASGNIGYGSIGGVTSSATLSALRSAMVNSVAAMNGGRIGMSQMLQDPASMNHQQQPQDMGNRLMGGLGSNSFSNIHYDWKTSP